MKHTYITLAALSALFLASCQTQTVMLGGSGGAPTGHPGVRSGGRTTTVQHRCSVAGGRTISIRGVPVGVPFITCKHCRSQVPCGSGSGYAGYRPGYPSGYPQGYGVPNYGRPPCGGDGTAYSRGYGHPSQPMGDAPWYDPRANVVHFPAFRSFDRNFGSGGSRGGYVAP